MLSSLNRHSKIIAASFFMLIYVETIFAYKTKGDVLFFPHTNATVSVNHNSTIIPPTKETATSTALNSRSIGEKKLTAITGKLPGGPGQPEMQSFQSVNSNNMVDLFSGDFSYNIPLLDVGGYPINLAYRSGISMDQEASWVGLGWNVNPGTITRNMRGLPDDFDGADSIKKITSIKENKTVGVTSGVNDEIFGLPLNVGASFGVFHNNYKGWGIEKGINATINSGKSAKGPLSAGLSINDNSQEGMEITPSLSLKLSQKETEDRAGMEGTFSTSLPYSSRYGLKGLQLSSGIRQTKTDTKNQEQYNASGSFSSVISFASPSYTPTITIPYTSRQYSFTGKVGFEYKGFHPSLYISGYVAKQRIDPKDTLLALPAYGYLYYQDGARNNASLLDFNREKELPYREKPLVPHIAVPIYTYDAFSITGEGTGGMFRAYRGDIGFVHDHFMRTKDESGRLSVDVGVPDLVHLGVDLNVNRAFTQTGPWLSENSLRNIINFRNNTKDFEAAYFRNPAEKAINSKKFYETIGGDDVVAVQLYQPSSSSPIIQATNYLTRYKNKRVVGSTLLKADSTIKTERDKRTQVISYLTAKEADVVGVSKYIESFTPNTFRLDTCSVSSNPADMATAVGLSAQYFPNKNFTGTPQYRIDPTIHFDWVLGAPSGLTGFPADNFSVRWSGRLKAPVSGAYTFTARVDDGVRLWINDSVIINKWWDQGVTNYATTVNLVANEMYNIKMEYYDHTGRAQVHLYWQYPGHMENGIIVPQSNLYPPAIDTFKVNNYLVKEKRVNSFRKSHHLSEIDVLNNDGKRYIYGIPVYNLKQKEATFAVKAENGNNSSGLVKYTNGVDNSTSNSNGKDNYFNSEETPAYAHSFLLTGILSADYVDVTNNGITDDDLGDAVKFNYSKISGIGNPYRWRAPYVQDSVTLNEGLKTDNRDDKGNYVYGEKELWYLHSVQSKTMIATFVTEGRTDLQAIDETGNKINDHAPKRLKEINLYSKADLIKNPTHPTPIKTVHFEYSYELCKGVNKPVTDSGKLTLKRVWFTYNGNNKGKQNPYVFNYNSKNPDYNIKSYDRWGNYKDPQQNPGYSTGNPINNAEYPYAIQDSTLAAGNAAAWSLDSIYLPSGGAIKVDFESDDYAYVQNKRAMQLFKLAGFGTVPNLTHPSDSLYNRSSENLYVYVSLPKACNSTAQFYQQYLTGINKLFFRLFVKMPGDPYGAGNEYVSCYADLESGDSYGRVNDHLAWIKIVGISLKGDDGGSYSPLVKASTQFLRLNLPSKAYPGSEVGDNIDLDNAVKLVLSLADNIKNTFSSFDRIARENRWCSRVDTSRSYIRLYNPDYKKIGGGHRVKRITIYDNWDKMTGQAAQRGAKYGQEYTYTTREMINGAETLISSGVASYEPGIGGEENPFHEPIEYTEKISPLGPVTLGYSEEPLGESLFPAAGIGYSNVRVRTINYVGKKSANGYEESSFYTAHDFPTYTDRSMWDVETKKRFRPAIANFLRINARHYLTLSQGFKIELNDMHGKLRSKAVYGEADPNNYISYTENIYKLENAQMDNKRLSNNVTVMKPDGTIDTSAVIGKDVELMVDMREQLSITNGNNINLNTDMFSAPFVPPFFLIPSFISLAQREENKFHSVATLKIVQRYGIVDSVISIDKGSKVSTKDVMYDSETGDALLTRTNNEFNDPVYNFTYPSHWAYNGMGAAYANIGLVLSAINIRDGKIIGGLPNDSYINKYFSNGDELLVEFKQNIGNLLSCNDILATFRKPTKIWAIDVNATNGGATKILFVDQYGKPFTGKDVNIKITRSGRRNIFSSVGTITSLSNPLVKTGNAYRLRMNDTTRVIQAQAITFNDKWKTAVTCNTCGIDSSFCGDVIPANYQQQTISMCFAGATHRDYSSFGSLIHSSTTDYTGSLINSSNAFWKGVDTLTGPLNRTGVWKCSGCQFVIHCPTCTPNLECTPGQTWIGFSKQVYIPTTGNYYIGMGGDNMTRVTVDGNLFNTLLYSTPNYNFQWAFKYWHIYPIYLTAGYHVFKFEGWNADALSAATFGGELYRSSIAQLQNATSYAGIDTVFSTRNITGQTFTSGYSCPIGYTLDSSGGNYICTKGSNGVQEINNPVTKGMFSNWRQETAFTYYASRAENDPSSSTNIRVNGTYAGFSPYWGFSNGVLKAQSDTTKWIWNTKITLHNSRGFELENKDALERYNSGVYGYNNTLPIAVTQNSRYRESAFDGFEDYDYSTQTCGSPCSANRHFSFERFKNKMDTTEKHSGRFSLKVMQADTVAIAAKLVKADESGAVNLLYTASNNACVPNNDGAISLTIDTTAHLPIFSPLNGKRMLLSAWVKEDNDCHCSSYKNNSIVVSFSGGSGAVLNLTPSGNIIEGWQRYESVFNIPDNDTSMVIRLKATSDTAVYFDDLRVQPFNANMKSFVYHPINLRLMAEQDENNYTSYYEYDDDGSLIRVKKETERGIQTIKETRSGLLKQ